MVLFHVIMNVGFIHTHTYKYTYSNHANTHTLDISSKPYIFQMKRVLGEYAKILHSVGQRFGLSPLASFPFLRMLFIWLRSCHGPKCHHSSFGHTLCFVKCFLIGNLFKNVTRSHMLSFGLTLQRPMLMLHIMPLHQGRRKREGLKFHPPWECVNDSFKHDLSGILSHSSFSAFPF